MSAPHVETRYPAPPPGVFRISQSTAETVLRCGLRKQLQDERNYRRTTVPMARGTGVAAGAREDNRSKIVTGAGRPLPEIVEAAVAAYETETATCELAESKAEIGRGKDSTAEAARVYGQRVSPQIVDVLAAEEPIVARLGDDFQLVGTLDVACKIGLGDGKVGQPWTQQRADHSRQLSSYGILFHARWGENPRRVWIDSIGWRGGTWVAERFWSSRGPADYHAYYNILLRVREALEKGIALPAPEAAWWCGPKWCEFWHECPCAQGR